MKRQSLAVVLATGLAACGGDPDITGIELAIGTSAPLGFSNTVAMAAIAGETVPCAAVTTACTAPPCAGAVDITVGAGCPMPVGETSGGTVTVNGDWSAADSAVLTSVFTNANAGDRSLVVVKVNSSTVSRSGDIVTITYIEQDVEASEETTKVDQSAWTVTVDTKGTYGDPTDDVITMNGTKQTVDGTDVKQMALSDVVMEPGCKLNPVSGSATLQDVGVLQADITTLNFHSACDGMVDTGVSISLTGPSGGDSIPINLTRGEDDC